jgi:hypothetical protein
MGLGRTTRFAALPAGARRVSVMRAGTAGIKALAPPRDLFDDFAREKRKAKGKGVDAHLEAFRRTNYRERFLRAIRGSAESLRALRGIIDEARARDVYLMCMCPYAAAGGACHTYLLLDLAKEAAPELAILPEPKPRGRP